MPFTHRGQSTGGNHTPISRAAKRDIKALAERSGGNMRNLPMEDAKAAMERHGSDIFGPLWDAVDSHGAALRAQRHKQAQRREKVDNLKNAVVSKVAPYRATAYEMDLGYGGPEEGGWNYDIATPVADSRPFLTRRGAEKAATKMQDEFPNQSIDSGMGKRYTSVAYQGGDFRVDVQRGRGKQSPDVRPRYE